MLKRILFAFFISSMSFCVAQEDILSVSSIPQELKNGANAVVRLNDLDVLIESQRKMTIKLDRVVTVLNEKGRQYPRTLIGYDNYRKIKKIEATIYDAQGNEIKKFRKRDFIDHSAVDGGTLYSDSRFLFIGYTPVNYPYTVRFSYELETPNTAGLPTWQPIYGYFLSVENDTFTIHDPTDIGLRFKEKNFEDYDINKTIDNSTITYSLKNRPILRPEDLSPSLDQITPILKLAGERFHFNGVDGIASDWVDFGDWMINSLLKDRNAVTKATETEILNLVSGIENPIEKAKVIYEYVQNNTRYISVQVGIGGIQPIPAIEVDKLKYGDCKGLTNYTQALLDIAGVPSYYSVVEAGSSMEDFEEDFASLEQGNHIILAIPKNDDELLWIDCTSQKHPFGFIGDFTDNRNVLVVKKGQSEIVKTQAYIDDQNHQLMEAKIKLNADSSIESQVNVVTRGVQYDDHFPLEEADNDDILEYYKNFWGTINNLEVINYEFKNDKDQVVFSESINLFARDYASNNDDKLIFVANVLNRNDFIPKRYRNRKTPLKILRGYMDEDHVEVSIPEGYAITELPENINISNKFGSYTVEFSNNENVLNYNRKLLIKKGTYSKEDYEEYRKFRRTVAKHDNSIIILNKS